MTGGQKPAKLARCCPLKVLVSERHGKKCQVSPCVTGDAPELFFFSLRKPSAQPLGSQGEATFVFYGDEKRPVELLALAVGAQQGPQGCGFVSPPALPSWPLSARLCNLCGHVRLAPPGGALRGGRVLAMPHCSPVQVGREILRFMWLWSSGLVWVQILTLPFVQRQPCHFPKLLCPHL